MNRLCTQVADQYGWGFANINLRAYYAEGAKTYGFEIAEQLGWRFPRHVVSPVAGGTLLPRILKAFDEFRRVGLVSGDLPSVHAAQAAGCAPVVRALEAGLEFPDPVKPKTVAKSIAIGNPAAVMLASNAYVGYGDDELAIAGGLMREPLRLAKCETINVEVPAEAEVVLEAEFRPINEVATLALSAGERVFLEAVQRRFPPSRKRPLLLF